MYYIEIRLMYTPQTYVKDKIIRFPYKKAEALFYYVAVEKIVTRDQAAAMFWNDCDYKTSKKNLRQTLYALKKVFGGTVIRSLPNHLLGISDGCKVNCDLDGFYGNRDLQLYRGEIFQGFCVKNAEPFEEWLSNNRAKAKSFFISNCLERMQSISENDFNELEKIFNRYVSVDPFDERAYIIMLQGYLKNGIYHKGIQLYRKLCSLLDENLGIVPATKTTKLYYKLLDNWLPDDEREAGGEYAAIQLSGQACIGKGLVHADQMGKLKDAYVEHLTGKGKAVLIKGEAGIGKTFLATTFLDADVPEDALVLKVVCHMKSKESALHPWSNLILQLRKYMADNDIEIPNAPFETIRKHIPLFDETTEPPDNIRKHHDYKTCKDAILQISLLAARNKQLVILFENIHGMDVASLDILANFIQAASQEIFIICTCLNVSNHDIETFTNAEGNGRQLTQIELNPICMREAKEIICSQIGSGQITNSQIDEIYMRSQGNLFFIQELLCNIKNGYPLDSFSPDTRDMLDNRLSGLDKSANSLLEMISVFDSYATLADICFIQRESASEILKRISRLKERGLILENISDDKICFSFAHTRLRDFVYSRLSASEKRNLHYLAGIAYEQSNAEITGGRGSIIRHFTLGGNMAKALQYKIQMFASELIPEYEWLEKLTEESGQALSPLDYLRSLAEELASIKKRQPRALEYDKLEANLLLLQSRCSFLCGEVGTGAAALCSLLDMDYIWANRKMLLKAYIQIIDYIVKNSDSISYDYIEEQYEKVKDIVGPPERAMFQQLRALPFILGGSDDKARFLLIEAVNHILEANKTADLKTHAI